MKKTQYLLHANITSFTVFGLFQEIFPTSILTVALEENYSELHHFLFTLM